MENIAPQLHFELERLGKIIEFLPSLTREANIYKKSKIQSFSTFTYVFAKCCTFLVKRVGAHDGYCASREQLLT